MCWMTIRRDDAPLASGIEACKRHESHAGGHSWGYAISDGVKIETFKQTGVIDRFKMSPEAEVALVHTRMATRGNITRENAHPFRLEWDDRAAALAHNGTWYGAPDDGRADSYHMARELEDRLRSGYELRRAIRVVGALTGETFIVLTDTGRALVHSGRFGITINDAGDVVASSDQDNPIRDGRIVEL